MYSMYSMYSMIFGINAIYFDQNNSVIIRVAKIQPSKHPYKYNTNGDFFVQKEMQRLFPREYDFTKIVGRGDGPSCCCCC